MGGLQVLSLQQPAALLGSPQSGPRSQHEPGDHHDDTDDDGDGDDNDDDGGGGFYPSRPCSQHVPGDKYRSTISLGQPCTFALDRVCCKAIAAATKLRSFLLQTFRGICWMVIGNLETHHCGPSCQLAMMA